MKRPSEGWAGRFFIRKKSYGPDAMRERLAANDNTRPRHGGGVGRGGSAISAAAALVVLELVVVLGLLAWFA